MIQKRTGAVASTNNTMGKGMLLSRTWDRLNRLTTIQSQGFPTEAAGNPVGFTYQYNDANQRTRADLADGTYWVYQYDALGQVISGRRYWNDGTLVVGQDFDYAFDDIGNRDKTGGRASAVSDYTNNHLNQYSQRTVPNKLDILGLANPTAGVQVWKDSDSPSTASRKGEYFHHPLTVANGTYPLVTVRSQYGATETKTLGRSFVPPATESFYYDPDGNLTSDGRWTHYVWDGENQLVEMRRDSTTPSEARQKLNFEYDHLGRRIRKIYHTHDGSDWVEQRDTIYLYDGWNIVAELDANNSNATLRTYVWGSDLSGSMTGAGGVGGLLWVNNAQTTGGLPTGIQFVAYDGNGNVAGLFSATDGSNTARYEYGPFGEPLRATGTLAGANPVRWSTKVTDDEGGLVYYGYRYYNPSTGRWLSRDPIGEIASSNVYSFVDNEAISYFDPDGWWKKGAGDLIALGGRGGPRPRGSLPVDPVTGLRMLLGAPFSILSGDIFRSDPPPVVEKGRCDVLIVVNGMLNKEDDRDYLYDKVSKSPRYAGAQAMAAVNRTASWFGDPIQIIGDELGAIQITSIRLAKQINSIYDQFKRDRCCCAKIQIFAHSQGTMVVNNALPSVRPEAMRLMYYTGIGGQIAIHGGHGMAGKPDNYLNRRDWVPLANITPLRWPGYVSGGIPNVTPTGSPPANWFEHNFRLYYEDFVSKLKPNGPCIPLTE